MTHQCRAPGCQNAADVQVALYDYIPHMAASSDPASRASAVFLQQDDTCPYLCGLHMLENEQQAVGVRQPRGVTRYPFSNQHLAQGFTIYAPLDMMLPR